MNPSVGTLLLRVDASTEIGIGHVMRCLALAQAWRGLGGNVVCATAMPSTAVEDMLASDGVDIVHLQVQPGSVDDATHTAELGRRLAARAVVLDGYHFRGGFQRVVREAGLYLLTIDDNSEADHYWADVVLNQNIHAAEAMYPNREPFVRLLLGTGYTLLRQQFLPWRARQQEPCTTARKVLVTLGGSDPANVTLKAVDASLRAATDNLQVGVVVGVSNPHRDALEAAVSHAPVNIRLETGAPDMPALMSWADVAISAAGSTLYELAFLGVPTLAVIVAENQVSIARGLGEAGTVINMGWHTGLSSEDLGAALRELLSNPQRRHVMRCRGQVLVDGFGAKRIAAGLASGFPGIW